MDKKLKEIKYEVYEAVGGHKVRGTKVDGEWWNLSQYQLVNGHWTDVGCNWFNKEEMIAFLEEQGELKEKGTGELMEFVDDPELKGKVVAVSFDEFGNEVFL